MNKLFVYDECAELEVIQLLLGKEKVLLPAVLREHGLFKDDQEQYFIKKSQGHRVAGYIIEVNQNELRLFDSWKNIPDYVRTTEKVWVQEDEHEVYIFTKKKQRNHSLVDAFIHKKDLEQVRKLQNFQQHMIYPALDLYIMIPCLMDDKRKLLPSEDIDASEIADEYMNEIEKMAKYEMDAVIAAQLTRQFLGQVEIICLTDHVEQQQRSEHGRMKVNMVLTKHEKTKLACVTLIFPNMTIPVTYIMDQMSQNELCITSEDGQELLLTFLYKAYGLSRMGMSRSFTNLSKSVAEQDLMYLLANEANGSNVFTHKHVGKELKEAAHTNIAQFDFSEIYIHRTSIVQIYKKYEDRYNERLRKHVLTLFIMELVLMQDVAISRVSNKVSAELSNQSKISLKVIKDLNYEFAITRFLWNLNHFTYSATQIVVNSIIRGFRIHEQLEAYNTNKEFLESLVNVQNAWNAERKTRLLNISVIFLTISQVYPIYYQIPKIITAGKISVYDIKFFIYFYAAILIIYFISKFSFSKRR